MKTMIPLAVALSIATVAILPTANAGSPLSCDPGLVDLVLCIYRETYEEAWRDVGIVLGLAEPVVRATCLIVFGEYPCIYINADSALEVPVLA